MKFVINSIEPVVSREGETLMERNCE